MTAPHGANVRVWAAHRLAADVRGMIDRVAASADVVHVAVMPDVHLAEEVCVGCVVATTNTLYPQAVGGDIGCGMAAMALEASADDVDEVRAARILDRWGAEIPAIRRARANHVAIPDSVLAMPLSRSGLETCRDRDGTVEFATLGRGNHFIELQAGDDDRLWLMVHSGSRAIGPEVRNHHLWIARAAGAAAYLAGLGADRDDGRDYLADVAFAIAYAEASRRAMLARAAASVADVLRCAIDEASVITCVHNSVRREVHDGRASWVHRKGAAPAAHGEPGIIPGSMGAESFHVVGRGCSAALASSSHGAGRVMARGDARRLISRRRLEREMEGVWFDHRLAARLVDEAPSAYKDIGEVMRAQADLVRIERRLRPLISYKGA